MNTQDSSPNQAGGEPTVDLRMIPVPRTIRKRRGKGRAGCFVRIFILPHTLIGLSLLLYTLYLTSLSLFGEQVNGRITDRIVGTDSENNPTYDLRFSFVLGGSPYDGSLSVSKDEYDQYDVGDTIRLLVHSLVPWFYPRIADGPTDEDLLFLWIMTLFWNGILSVFLYLFYVRPILIRRVIINGSVAIGTITGKRVSSTRNSTSYKVYYDFTAMGIDGTVPPFDATAQDEAKPPGLTSARMDVTRQEYEMATDGMRVNVLYHPRKPKRSVIYEFADYEVSVG